VSELVRCPWPGREPIYVAYHDEEWGVPERDSRALWEKLVLDGFQAGLSWITILKKRDTFRRAFHGFDPEMVARYGEGDVARLLGDAGIVRSRAKIDAAINGARVWLRMRDEGRDFSDYLWSFTGGEALRKEGFNFVGPVIVYAFMQAIGMVNDHLTCCFRHEPVRRLGAPVDNR
jgi:DNA-3-methyladenine glycosylase I